MMCCWSWVRYKDGRPRPIAEMGALRRDRGKRRWMWQRGRAACRAGHMMRLQSVADMVVAGRGYSSVFIMVVFRASQHGDADKGLVRSRSAHAWALEMRDATVVESLPSGCRWTPRVRRP